MANFDHSLVIHFNLFMEIFFLSSIHHQKNSINEAQCFYPSLQKLVILKNYLIY
jgi:hypothetical protein